MDQQTLSTSIAPEVVIEEVLGSLQVKGWDRLEVSVKANPSDLSLEEQDDVITIRCRSSCIVRLPQDSTVRVESVHGEARFKYLDDQIQIGQVLGPLVLREVGETQVEAVHGELSAKHLAGDLVAAQVLGNAIVRDVQGQCLLEDVKGNLDLRDVESTLKADVAGNARIRLSVMAGEGYEIQAGGNLNCRVPEDASLRLNLTSGAQAIRVKLPAETKNYTGGACDLVLGTGAVLFTASANGAVYLASQPVDEEDVEGMGEDMGEDFGLPADFGQQIARQVESQIEAQMEAMTRQLNEQMANLSASIGKFGLSESQTEQILKKAQQESERAQARAQEKIRRTQKKLERKLESTRRRNELKNQAAERRAQARSRRGWNAEWSGPQPPQPPRPPQPTADAVSDEERLLILRMLEQKKITIEEAEQLLSALEGKE